MSKIRNIFSKANLVGGIATSSLAVVDATAGRPGAAIAMAGLSIGALAVDALRPNNGSPGDPPPKR